MEDWEEMKVRTCAFPHYYIEKTYPVCQPKVTKDIRYACNYEDYRAKEVAAKENLKLGWRKWEAK